MFNVNFEMIYWQALSGNLPELLRTALDYVESQMDGYRENARKLWGCRGIWINSVNTPESGRSAAMNNHIINWTTGAGWVAQHFYDYYRYTGDVEYLREHALPFMKEAAEFFEDFLYIGKDGKYEFSPSVSPENVPLNVSRDLGSRSEVTKNAAMDVAITRELLTNLLEGARLCGMYEEKLPVWEKMLTLLPEYRFNADGSLKEWIHDFYEDQNSHRHHSHVYGVFPGHSINRMSPEYDAFVKAEDNRLAYGLKAQSSWSAVYMAGVNARMGRGDISHLVLSEMLRTCLMGNLFTVHNDWRRTGSLSCDDFQIAPFQIDANIGFTAIVNEMLVGCADGTIRLLPALPTQWKSGEIKNVRTVGGWLVSIRWNEDGAKAKIRGGWAASAKVCCGDGWRFADGSTEKEITGDGTIVNLCRVQSDA